MLSAESDMLTNVRAPTTGSIIGDAVNGIVILDFRRIRTATENEQRAASSQ
jgi:hypothetical protein